MWVLGIAASHNGAVALTHDGRVVAAIQAERLSRIKRQSIRLNDERGLLSRCVQYCLDQAGIACSQLHAIAISSPWRISRMKEQDLFERIGGVPSKYRGTVYVPHHFAHMEYILHYGSLQPGIVLIVDGSGSHETDRAIFGIEEKVHPGCVAHVDPRGKETLSAYVFDGNDPSLIFRFSPPVAATEECNRHSNGLLQSIGHYWRWAGNYCCGSTSAAGKVMGAAAFGDRARYSDLNILSLATDGRLSVNYTKLAESFERPNVFGQDISGDRHYADVAAMVQSDTQRVLLELLGFLQAKHRAHALYYSGGVALNVVANEAIVRSGLFSDVVLNGSAEDNGTAIGAALAASNQVLGRVCERQTDHYGRYYTSQEILSAIVESGCAYEVLGDHEVCSKVASLICADNVVGWFQGRSEFGPRALGNRSILANPANPHMKWVLDLHMKRRDRYRPYAPAMMAQLASQYFDMQGTSPAMMREGRVLSNHFPAVTHVDGSARVQTVERADNPLFYELLHELLRIAGLPMVLNTSFNLPGEPIVESPRDAISCFTNGAMEYLCMGNYLVSRRKPDVQVR